MELVSRGIVVASHFDACLSFLRLVAFPILRITPRPTSESRLFAL